MSYKVAIEVTCDVCDAGLKKDNFVRSPGIDLPNVGHPFGWHGSLLLCDTCMFRMLDVARDLRKTNLQTQALSD